MAKIVWLNYAKYAKNKNKNHNKQYNKIEGFGGCNYIPMGAFDILKLPATRGRSVI